MSLHDDPGLTFDTGPRQFMRGSGSRKKYIKLAPGQRYAQPAHIFLTELGWQTALEQERVQLIDRIQRIADGDVSPRSAHTALSLTEPGQPVGVNQAVGDKA